MATMTLPIALERQPRLGRRLPGRAGQAGVSRIAPQAYRAAMAKHDVRLKLQAEVPVGNVDLEIPVRIDGALRGRLQISTGTVDWRPRSSKKPIRLTWSALADLIEENGRRVD